MERLRTRFLNVPLDAVIHPASKSAQRAAAEQKSAADSALALQEEELTAQQWFERGFVSVDPNEQLRFYTKAIELKPDFAEAFSNRGNTRRAIGDPGGALQDYDEAIRLIRNVWSTYDHPRALSGVSPTTGSQTEPAYRLAPTGNALQCKGIGGMNVRPVPNRSGTDMGYIPLLPVRRRTSDGRVIPTSMSSRGEPLFC